MCVPWQKVSLLESRSLLLLLLLLLSRPCPRRGADERGWSACVEEDFVGVCEGSNGIFRLNGRLPKIQHIEEFVDSNYSATSAETTCMLNRTSDITQSTPEWQGVRKSREVNYSEGSREAEEERSPKALPEIKRSKM